MNNEQLLKARWKNTDKLLKDFKKTVKGLTKDLKTEILDMFDNVNIALKDLNRIVSKREKERLDKLIRQWQKERLNNDYLSYRVATRKRNMTYAEYITLLLLGIYAMYMKALYDKSKTMYTAVAKDAVKQAEKEMGRPPLIPFTFKWGLLDDLLIVQTLQMGLYAYLQALAQTNADEAYKIFLQSKQVSDDAGVSQEGLELLLNKQENRLIDYHGDKESGIFVDTSRQLWNEMYVEPYKRENAQVRFIAEIDKATTMMCKGMDNMLFYTNDWNRYYRWSELDKKDVLYTTLGLKVGENLPPINNHFHWCRSTITYQVEQDSRLLAEFNQMRRWIPEYLPETFEEYQELCRDENYHNRMKLTEELKKHFERYYVRNGNNYYNVETERKLQHLSFDEYQKGYFTVYDAVAGVETANGIIVEGISFHCYDRMLERNVENVNAIVDTLQNGSYYEYLNKKTGDRSYNYDSEDYTVGVGKESHILTTIY